jgi:hypothetical protein
LLHEFGFMNSDPASVAGALQNALQFVCGDLAYDIAGDMAKRMGDALRATA